MENLKADVLVRMMAKLKAMTLESLMAQLLDSLMEWM